MSGRSAKRAWVWVLLGVLLGISTAGAEQTATYVVRGLGGAAVVGVGERTGTEAVAFAFTEAVAEKGDPPPVGPRLVFSVTWTVLVNGLPLRRQWYGDVPLSPETLAIALDLTKGQLDTEVVGTLEEHRIDGSVLRKEVKGRLEIRWVGSGTVANMTTAFTYQASGYAATLQTVGTGRTALTTGTATVEGMGGPVTFSGPGTLASVTQGLLSVKTP